MQTNTVSRTAQLFALMIGTLLIVSGATADSVGAQDAEIIILREVPPRPATRQAVPAPPFAVRTSPDIDVSAMKGIGSSLVMAVPDGAFLSDREAAAVAPNAPILQGIEHSIAISGKPGSDVLAGGTKRLGSGALANTIRSSVAESGSAPLSLLGRTSGTVQRATRGLGQTVHGAIVPR